MTKLSHLLLIALLLVLAGCIKPSARTHERISAWKLQLSTDIPKGSSKDFIIQWGKLHSINFDYLKKQNELYAVAERVPDNKAICTEWNVIIEITLDADGRCVAQNVHAVGSCV